MVLVGNVGGLDAGDAFFLVLVVVDEVMFAMGCKVDEVLAGLAIFGMFGVVVRDGATSHEPALPAGRLVSQVARSW